MFLGAVSDKSIGTTDAFPAMPAPSKIRKARKSPHLCTAADPITEAKLNKPATQIAPRRPNRQISVRRSVISKPNGAPNKNGAPTRTPNNHVFLVNGRSLSFAVEVEPEAAEEVIGLPREVITLIAAPVPCQQITPSSSASRQR